MKRALVWAMGALIGGLCLNAYTADTAVERGEATWLALEPGLELGTLKASHESTVGDSLIRVLRIDPKRFELTLHNAGDSTEGKRLTPRAWAKRHDLVAVTNASLYAKDLTSSVSLMRSRSHVTQPRLTKDRAILAFDALDSSVPSVQIIDRTCQPFDELRKHYGSLVQSIRMISCSRENVWQPQPLSASMAAVGTDRQGRVLFLHVSSPYIAHDFVNFLLELPLELNRAMYVEGGPEAQLFVASGKTELELTGRHRFLQTTGDPAPALPLPNVIGLRRR